MSYRFYRMAPDTHICGAEDRDCADDVAALDLAYALSGDCGIEVWQAERMVCHVKHGALPSNATDRFPG